MNQCPQCGTATQPGQAFCGVCGANLAAPASEQAVIRPRNPQPSQPVDDAVPPTVQFPVTPPQAWGAPPPPTAQGPDLSVLLRGNWVVAATTAGIALGTAFVLGLVVAFAGAEDLDVVSAVWTGLMLTVGAFGANLQLDLANDFGADEALMDLGQYPLLATVLALGAAAAYFRRRTAGYRRLKDYLLDAARAGLILSLATFLIALVVEVAGPETDGYGSLNPSGGGSSDAFGLVLVNGDTTSSLAGSLFLPFLLLLLVLGLVAVTRRDWWPGRLAAVPAWLAAPLAGYAALVAGLVVAGLLWTVAQAVGDEDARGLAEVVRLLAVLPAAGLHLVGLGSLSKVGETTEVDADGGADDDSSWNRLWDFADDNGALFWVAPLAALAVAALAVSTVVRRTPDRSQVLRSVAVYLGGLVLVVPLLVRFANTHVSFSAEGGGESVESETTAGSHGFQTMLLFLLLSALVAAVVLVVNGVLDLGSMKARASAFARSVQSNPAQQHGPPPQAPPPYGPPPYGPPPQVQPGQQPQPWGPPPPQPPWGQQPPPHQPPPPQQG